MASSPSPDDPRHSANSFTSPFGSLYPRPRARRTSIKTQSRHCRRITILLFVSTLLTLAYVRLHWALSTTTRLDLNGDLQRYEYSAKASATASASMAVDSFASPPVELGEFLRESKKIALDRLSSDDYDSNAGQPIVLVMGNGAGDLDSFTSAISLSHFLTHYSHKDLPLTSPLPANAHYIPLIQTNRTDAHLRPENIASTSAANLTQDDILYISDLPESVSLCDSPRLGPQNGVYLALVDHPQLELSWVNSHANGAERKVVAVVDHHADAGQHTDASLRVFRLPEGVQDANPTGSAQSVIVDLFADHLKTDPSKVPRNLADLAISTVLIDTDNLRPMPKGRASQTDLDAVQLLLPLSSLGSPDTLEKFKSSLLASAPEEVQQTVSAAEDAGSISASAAPTEASSSNLSTSSVWTILSSSKNAISHLSTLDLLKRDYKTSSYNDLKAGFSSVNMGLPAWLHRGDTVAVTQANAETAWQEWWTALLSWMSSQNLDIAVVGTSFQDVEKDKHARELVVAAGDRVGADAFHKIVKLLEQEQEAETDGAPLRLNTPWKGWRLEETGKKERVCGLDKTTLAVQVSQQHQQQQQVWAQVWKQGNAKANRKVYLPRIMGALQLAIARR